MGKGHVSYNAWRKLARIKDELDGIYEGMAVGNDPNKLAPAVKILKVGMRHIGGAVDILSKVGATPTKGSTK